MKHPEGSLYGRPDIERCDLFIDQGFMNWGPFGSQFQGHPMEKGRQMLSNVAGTKCGIQAQSGYFEKEFKRAFSEPYSSGFKKDKTPYLNGVWYLPGCSKHHSTPNDIYGTFIKELQTLSPLTKPKPPSEPQKSNFYTNPGKKGNCGYLNITLNPYPEFKPNYYDAGLKLYRKKWEVHKQQILNGPFHPTFYPQAYFWDSPYKGGKPGPTYAPVKKQPPFEKVFYPPARPKKPGNSHAGCFNEFPHWMPDKYMTPLEVKKVLDSKGPKLGNKIFQPAPQTKTYYWKSVVNNKLNSSCNARTWTKMTPISYP